MTTLAAPPNTLQASIMLALGGDQPERALEQAFIQLSRGGDLPLLLAMVKALVRIGTAGLAVRLLQSGGGLLAAEPQLAALADQLAGLPSGEVARDALHRQYRQNLKALSITQAELAGRLPSSNQLPSQFHVFQSTRGNQFVVRDNTTGRLEFVFPFADHTANAATMNITDVAVVKSFLMHGVPNPRLWNKVLSLRTPNGYLPPIDVVETDMDVFCLWLQQIDGLKSLGDDRVSLFIGSDAIFQYRQCVLNHAWRPPASHWLTNLRPRWPVHGASGAITIDKKFIDELESALRSRKRRSKDALDERYADRDASWWRRRFAAAGRTDKPLRIAGFTTRFSTVIQHSMRDLATAFHRQGCQFDIIMQPSPSCASVDVVGALFREEFDLIVVIDHLRSEFSESMPANIPYVCWIQDHMQQLCDKRAGQSVSDLDLVIGHSPHVMAALYDYPTDRFLASNNLTDATTYSNEPLGPTELEPYRCDVSFVSHGAGTPQQLIEEITAGSIPEFRRMLESFLTLARKRLNVNGWINSQELVELMLEAESQSGHPELTPEVRRSRVYPQLARIYDRLFRHQTLEWTANWARSRGRNLKLYGKGWQHHPTLSPFNAGEVESGHELRSVYQASVISLQVNGHSSLHQRLLDGLAAGAFMLCRYNPADFIRSPFADIQKAIVDHRLKNLADLCALRSTNDRVRAACESAERLCNIRIAPLSDPARQAYSRVLQNGNLIPELLTDEGMFQSLTQMRLIPTRVAADLAGFFQVVFQSESELHEMLDRYVDDQQARQAVARPLRQSVVAHDTYDGLVDRILAAFGAQGIPSCAG